VSGVSLTEAEREALIEAIQNGDQDAFVEAIIAARLAPIEALAEQWNSTPDYSPTDYDRGRVDQRHDMTGQLLEALTPDRGTRQADRGEG
jgi:hypothetical protein